MRVSSWFCSRFCLLPLDSWYGSFKTAADCFGVHAIQYGIILLMVAVVFSTVIIYAPHNTIPESTNETISNAVSSN